MKKQELATVLRDRLELGSLKDANRVIDEFAKILSEAMVAGDEVTLPDVGSSFPERIFRNVDLPAPLAPIRP